MIKNKKIKKIKNSIISYLRKNRNKQYNYKQICFFLEIKDTESKKIIINIINNLIKKKIIRSKNLGKVYFKKEENKNISGILEITSSGKGYVLNKEFEKDIFISNKNLNKAFNGDKVEVYLYKRKDKKSKLEGEIVNIVNRKNNFFTGELHITKSSGFVKTKGGKMYTDFYINKEQIREFINGDKVVVKLKDWPERSEIPNGEIIKSLGKSGETDTEINAILNEYNLPNNFSKKIEEEANKIVFNVDDLEIKKRKDFRKILTFTIDPITAKDYDDALSFNIINKDIYEIGIHIADVTHYIKKESIIDKEAYERGTSVYLVDRVIPMLPEILSNGVCSLRENEEKYTFSAVFKINNKAEILDEWYGKTIIKSNNRFSYEEVQSVLETKSPVIKKEDSLNKIEYKLEEKTFFALQKLNEISKKLRKERIKKGAISFDRVEVEFLLNRYSLPKKVFFKKSKDANKLIEEFMLLANKKVAEYYNKKHSNKNFIYRVHDKPDINKINNLKEVAKNFGHNISIKEKEVSSSINNLLLSVKGKKEQNLINTLTIRCMSKAEYTTNNIGHYGLAFKEYSHFTSPIRRYPDIMVHRLLNEITNNNEIIKRNDLEEKCNHCSQQEILATKAERDSIKFMQIKFMEDKLGETFEGVVSGVTERGLYVELTENKCEGMIRIKEIKDDYYLYNEKNHFLVGKRNGNKIQLGDIVEVNVKKVNILKRHLDFEFVKTI